jgi:hypothetical protein
MIYLLARMSTAPQGTILLFGDFHQIFRQEEMVRASWADDKTAARACLSSRETGVRISIDSPSCAP